MRHYTAEIITDDGSGYGVIFPDFPGCLTSADTIEQAILRAGEALKLHVEGMLEDGEAIPEPSQPGPVKKRSLRKDYCATILVPVRLPSPAKRVNITIDSDLLEAIDATARAQGTTRSGFLAQAARIRIREDNAA